MRNRDAERCSPRAAPARGQAGYNLIELLMAMTLATIIFMSITTLYSYQAESITAQSHVLTTSRDARFALEHMRRDLLSIGSNATANSVVDDQVCPKPAVPIRGLTLDPTKGHVVREDLNPNLRKLAITLFGSLDVKTRYATESITGKEVKLVDDGTLPATEALWNETFKTSRFLRLGSPDGRSMILSIAATGFSAKTVTLATAPPQMVGAQRCGYQGAGGGLTVDVQGFVRYRIIADQRPTAPTDAKGQATRTLLVREALDTDGATVVGALPLAENVVEIGVFDAGYDNNPAADVVELKAATFTEDMVKADGSGLFGTAVSARPEALRFLTVKLSVRGDAHRRGLTHLQRKYKYLPLETYKLDESDAGAASVTTIAGRITFPALTSRNL
ncbi:MAG: hypothetical protein RIT45_3251 [Pseudomonadota bacterium]